MGWLVGIWMWRLGRLEGLVGRHARDEEWESMNTKEWSRV